MLEIEPGRLLDYKEIPETEETNGIGNIRSTEVYETGKRVFDIFASLLAIIILFLPMLVICLIVYIDDPKGSPIFKQYRCGKDGKLFTIYKFRTMCVNAEDLLKDLKKDNEMDGHAFKIKNDPRVTRVGKFLRVTCIDELPQLYNVLCGDMSIVGPRPPLPNEVKEYSESDMERLSVVPGLTCYWQVQPNKNSIAFEEWMKLDKKYISERAFSVDLKVIFKTILVIFHMQGC